MDLEDAAGREPAGERIADDRRVDARRAGQGEGLGDGGDGGTHDQLVACLGQLPGTRATDPDDRATHRLEDGSCALDGGRVAADHDRQRAVGRADLAARHRCVEERATARGAALGERRHRGRQVGAHRAHDQPVVGTGQDAGRSVEDRLEVRGVGDHDDEDVDQPGDLGRRGGGARAGVGQLGHGSGRPRGDRQREAGTEDAPRHRPAHDAQPDEPDPGRRVPRRGHGRGINAGTLPWRRPPGGRSRAGWPPRPRSPDSA